jgi:cytochrome o ubiquinol oxidase subunit 3
MSATHYKYPGLNLGGEHPDAEPAAEVTVFGFWVFLMSDAVLFGLLFSTYVSSVHATAGGPGPEALYDVNSVFVETLLLLASSFSFGMASLAMKYKHGPQRLVGWLLVTLVLGTGFLGLEARDLITMIAKGGSPERSGFLSAFFDLVPLHGLHVTAGAIWLVCLIGQIKRYGLDAYTKLGVMRLALFWHFLDIIWIAIFTVVYLAGLA